MPKLGLANTHSQSLSSCHSFLLVFIYLFIYLLFFRYLIEIFVQETKK